MYRPQYKSIRFYYGTVRKLVSLALHTTEQKDKGNTKTKQKQCNANKNAVYAQNVMTIYIGYIPTSTEEHISITHPVLHAEPFCLQK